MPSWLTFNTGTNTFSGTPLNDDVGTISVEVTATDEDGLTVSDIFDILVSNVNDALVLSSIGDQSTDELVELTFTASASDVDLPAQTLTYSLDETSTDKGMTINASTGAFSWTPSESQTGMHTTIIVVSDGTAADGETFTITVNNILGVDEALQAGIKMYPNPVDNQFKLLIENEYLGEVLIRVVNLQGQMVANKKFDKTTRVVESVIEIADLASGIYLVEIHNGDDVFTQRFKKN